MFTKNELLDAIDELEMSPATYQNCQKLSTFYSLYDHLYGDNRPSLETVRQTIIEDYGDSDFLRAVEGSDAEKVFMILDELLDAVKVLQPRLYDATLTALNDI